MGCGVVPGNVYALSGSHCRPHSSSIKQSILNWHDRLLTENIGATVLLLSSIFGLAHKNRDQYMS